MIPIATSGSSPLKEGTKSNPGLSSSTQVTRNVYQMSPSFSLTDCMVIDTGFTVHLTDIASFKEYAIRNLIALRRLPSD